MYFTPGQRVGLTTHVYSSLQLRHVIPACDEKDQYEQKCKAVQPQIRKVLGIRALPGELRLVQRTPPVHGPENDRDIQECENADSGTPATTFLFFICKTAKRQIPDVHEHHDRGRGESRVPCPPDAPCRASPDGA